MAQTLKRLLVTLFCRISKRLSSCNLRFTSSQTWFNELRPP